MNDDIIVNMIDSIIDKDNKGRPVITIGSIGFIPFVLLQFLLSIVVALMVFAACAVFILLIDGTGILDMINRLLGSTMAAFTTGKLFMLSGVFAGAVGVLRLLYEIMMILLVNAGLMLIGGMPVKLYSIGTMRSLKKPETMESSNVRTTVPVSSVKPIELTDTSHPGPRVISSSKEDSVK